MQRLKVPGGHATIWHPIVRGLGYARCETQRPASVCACGEYSLEWGDAMTTETTLLQGYAEARCAICNLPGIYATHDSERDRLSPSRPKQAPKACGRLRCMTQTGEMEAV